MTKKRKLIDLDKKVDKKLKIIAKKHFKMKGSKPLIEKLATDYADAN